MAHESPLRTIVAARLSKLGLSQAELARRAGVNPQYVNDLLKGKKARARLAFAFQLALALEVPPLQILRALGLLKEDSVESLARESDRLTVPLGGTLQIATRPGKTTVVAADHVPVAYRPFTFAENAVRASFGHTRKLQSLKWPEFLSRAPGSYGLLNSQTDNLNFPTLAAGELLLVSPGLDLRRGDHFVGYVSGEKITAWVFSYIGREGGFLELSFGASRDVDGSRDVVRLPVRSLLAAHAVVGVIDSRILPR